MEAPQAEYLRRQPRMVSLPFSKGDVCASRQRDSGGFAAKPLDWGFQLSFLNTIFENPVIVNYQ